MCVQPFPLPPGLEEYPSPHSANSFCQGCCFYHTITAAQKLFFFLFFFFRTTTLAFQPSCSLNQRPLLLYLSGVGGWGGSFDPTPKPLPPCPIPAEAMKTSTPWKLHLTLLLTTFSHLPFRVAPPWTMSGLSFLTLLSAPQLPSLSKHSNGIQPALPNQPGRDKKDRYPLDLDFILPEEAGGATLAAWRKHVSS